MFSRIKKRRKMTWAILVWNTLILAWMVGGASSAQSDADCDAESSAEMVKLCQDATDVGTGIGVALIGVLGFMGFVALSLIWFMTRPKPERVVYVERMEAQVEA